MATVADLLTRARYVLNEVVVVDGVTWTNDELLGWYNDAVREVVKLDPSANQTIYLMTLAAGSRQTLPSDTRILMDVIGNYNGQQIRMVDRSTLDAAYPKWQQESQRSSIKNVMYDPNNIFTCWVYPPAIAGTKIEILLSLFPSDAADTAATVPLDTRYHTPIIDYILYRAFSKDAEDAASAQRAVAYMQQFHGAIANIVAVRTGASTTKE